MPSLPQGIDLSLSFCRATRSGPSEGLPIEDVSVEGATYVMTRDDLLNGNRDMLAALVAELRKLPFSRCRPILDRASRTIGVETSGLDRLDVLIDGHPGSSVRIANGEAASFSYPSDARMVEIIGFMGDKMRQRRRLSTRA